MCEQLLLRHKSSFTTYLIVTSTSCWFRCEDQGMRSFKLIRQDVPAFSCHLPGEKKTKNTTMLLHFSSFKFIHYGGICIL